MSNNNVPGSNQNINVQVRALTIDPAVTVQYKTKILHKNLVNGVNTLTQEMMSAINTKYVIKYDYVLSEDITIPDNCILEFDGGSISASGNNDTITGNHTEIIAGNEYILKGITLVYETFHGKVNPTWFYNGDFGHAMNQCISYVGNNFNNIEVTKGVYNLTTPIKVVENTNIDFKNSKIFVEADTFCITDINYGNNTDYRLPYVTLKNLEIDVNHSNSGYTIDIANTSYFTLENIVILPQGHTGTGIRVGRRTSNYNGVSHVTTIINCTCPCIEIEQIATDGYIGNCKLWAGPDYNSAGLIIKASSWQIIGNQLVGGSIGCIYIPDNITVSTLKIEGNFFDGSYENVNSHTGIITGTDSSFLVNSIICGNNFWRQKEYGIKGFLYSCNISNNIFEECDYYGKGLEDIWLDNNAGANCISNNIFRREVYLNDNYVRTKRPTENTTDYTKPSAIRTGGNNNMNDTIICGNIVFIEDYYNENYYVGTKFMISDNSSIFKNNINSHGNTRPSIPVVGATFFDTTLGKPIYWNGTAWVDSTGTLV